MGFTVIVLGALVLLMLAGALPAAGGAPEGVFRSPVFIGLLAVLSLALVRCSVRRGMHWRRLPFHIVHLGVVVLLLGALAGFVGGVGGDVYLPQSARHVIRQFRPGPGQAAVDFGFGVTAMDFAIDYHEPIYRLYRESETGRAPDAKPLRTARPGRDGCFDFGSMEGKIPASELKDADGGWVQRRVLPGGLALELAPRSPRQYRASLRFTDADGRTSDVVVAVNHPVNHGGWRFYLKSYGTDPMPFVLVTAKRNPGGWLVGAGIWMLILGTAATALAGRGGARES